MGQFYSPDKVIVTCSGIPIVGWASGTMVEIEFSEDRWENYVGARGDVTTVETIDQSGIMRLRLKHNSISTKVLNALSHGDTPAVFTMKDINIGGGITGYFMTGCFVERIDEARGDDIEELEYEIKIQKIATLESAITPL